MLRQAGFLCVNFLVGGPLGGGGGGGVNVAACLSKPFDLSPMAVFHALYPVCVKLFCFELSGEKRRQA